MADTLTDAIDRLAALYEYGELEAATSPQSFVGRVIDDVVGLRAQVAALTKERDELKQFLFENGKALCVMRTGRDRARDVLREVLDAPIMGEHDVTELLGADLRAEAEQQVGR